MSKGKCGKWLEEILADGEAHLCDDVREAAKKEGFSKNELREARKSIEVGTYHQFDEHGQTENWFWYIRRERQ